MSDMPPSPLARAAGGPDDGRPNHRIWTPELEDELRDVLRRFPRMDDPEFRRDFLNEVCRDLGMEDQSFCEFDNEERIHIARIVRACRDYPSQLAALAAFVKAMEYFRKNTKALQLLKDCEDSLSGLTILGAVRLHSVLNAIARLSHPPDQLKIHKIAARVRYEGEISPLDGSEELAEAVRRLNQHRDGDIADPPLVVRFLYALAAELEGPDGLILTPEVARIMADFGLQPAAVARAVNSRPAAPARTVFQIHVVSDSPPDQERYEIWAQAVERSEDSQQVIAQWPPAGQQSSSEEFPADDIDSAGSRFLLNPSLSAALGAAKDMSVEFLLPDSLLGHPVEQWPVDSNGYPIGHLCPVAVASLDRRNKSVYFRRWKERWEMLFGTGRDQPLCGRLGWLHDGDKPVPSRALNSQRYVEVTSRQDFARWLEDPSHRDTAILGLTFAYNPDDVTARLSFQSAIEEGIPVLVWRRDNGDANELEGRLTDVDINQLLRELYSWRRSANGPADCRNHVVVLWDDPVDIAQQLNRPLTAPR